MNKKGFTLIELLAVIVLIGLIFVFISPNIIGIYKDSKMKGEEIFVGKLEGLIDDYVKMNTDKIIYNESFEAQKIDYNNPNDDLTYNSYPVMVFKGTISYKDIIDSGLLNESEFINSGNKGVICDKDTAIIEVYKDSDYAYCYKLKKDALGCLSNEYQNKLDSAYAIDTCMWETITK